MKQIVKIIRPERPPLPPAPYADGYYIALVDSHDEPEVVQYGNRRFYQFGTYDEPETVRVIAPVSVAPTFEYRIEYKDDECDTGWKHYIDLFHLTPEEAVLRLKRTRSNYPAEHHDLIRLVKRTVSEWSVVE